MEFRCLWSESAKFGEANCTLVMFISRVNRSFMALEVRLFVESTAANIADIISLFSLIRNRIGHHLESSKVYQVSIHQTMLRSPVIELLLLSAGDKQNDS